MFTKNIFFSKKFYKSIGILLVIHFFCVFFILLTKQANAGERLFLASGDFSIQELAQAKSAKQQNQNVQEPSQNSAQFVGVIGNLNSSQANSKTYFVIQFKASASVENEKLLKSFNLEVLRYIPEDAFVVSGSHSSIQKIKASDRVQGVLPYKGLLQKSSPIQLQSVFERDQVRTVDIQVFKNSSTSQIANEIAAQGGVVLDFDGRAIVAELFGSQIESVTEIQGVEWIEDHANFELLSFPMGDNQVATEQLTEFRQTPSAGALTGYESGTRLMNFEKSWSQGYHGEGQIIAASDSGLDNGDQAHLPADFSSFYKGVSYGYASNTWADYVGHGTHVSGSILGNGTLSGGQVKGGANKAQLIMQSIWSQKQKAVSLPADLRVMFANSYASGARIHSNSWGDSRSNGRYDKAASQVDDFVWENPDMLILFAAGNNGADRNHDGRVDKNSINSPATAKNIITVGASENQVSIWGIQLPLGELLIENGRSLWEVEPLAGDTLSNNGKGLAAFSSRGPTQDGRIKPDLVAPGTNILSNCSHMEGSSSGWGQYDANYCFNGGTSMSTPLVAGAAALVRQHLMRSIQNPSAALIKGLLIHTAVDLFPGQFGEIGEANGQEILARAPNSDEGYGLVDVGAATSEQFQIVDDKLGVGTGGVKFYNLNRQVQKVTLVYSDAPASPTAGRALVNNLDLTVEVGGQVLKSDSQIENIEQITIPAGTRGSVVKVSVQGRDVPIGISGKQPFALIIN